LATAENYRSLRRRGVTIRKTVDVFIATACIEYGFELLHNDRDFDAMEPALGMRVVKKDS
jgi:predicted nucleic acid-binding protein